VRAEGLDHEGVQLLLEVARLLHVGFQVELHCDLSSPTLTRYIWLRIWISSRLSSSYSRI
jgi:hypothetical protein